jgi:hypothetical protein
MQDSKSSRTPGKSDSGSVLATETGGWRASDRAAAQSIYHRTMTAPATSRPRKRGTRIGGTSHSIRSNFWILDIPTAVPCGGSPKLSVTDSSQHIDGDGSQQTLFPSQCKAELQAMRASPLMARLREESDALHYIDSAHRGEVDIGCRSIHMQSQRELIFAQACPETRRLSYTNPMHDINQRHVAPTCASRIRTVYAHRKGRRARRSQALGRR